MIDLWYCFTDLADDAALLAEYRALLTDEERAEELRYRFPQGRRQLLVSRALARTALSEHAGCDPRVWRFIRNSYGKPGIAHPAGTGLEFNLSHTRGLAVCGVLRGGPIGVDVEDRRRPTDAVALSRRFFAPSEAAALAAQPDANRQDVFFQYWTLKEAFIKGRGLGFSLPLDRFAFVLEPGQPPRVTFEPYDQHRPEDWQFARLRPTDNYQVSVAAWLPPPAALRIRMRAALPLRWQAAPRAAGDDASTEAEHCPS